MARRNTKADRILNESAMRLEAARMRERLAQSQLNTAKAVLEAVQAAHDALKKELTAQPRKKSEKQVSAPAPLPVDKKVSDERCVANVPTLDVPCGEPEDALIHDPKGGYASYHPFEAPKPVPRSQRKSKQKSESTPSIQSSETSAEDALSVAHAASGGD